MRALVAAVLFSATRTAAIGMHKRSRSTDDTAGYYWPEPRGHPGHYSISPFTAPRNLSKKTLAWSWSNGGDVLKYTRAAHSGLVMDGEQNIYLSSTDGIRKFSADGKQLWFAAMATWRIPALSDGKVYVTDNDGNARALSMETGEVLWSSKFTTALGTDISGVSVHDGVLIAESAGNSGGGAAAVAGLDAQDGHKLWEFKSSSMLWNFMPMDAGNGTFIFQDMIGGVYHLRTKDGQLLWKSGYSGGWAQDFTDGLANVADGIVYAVHSDGTTISDGQKATLIAYELATGKKVWSQSFPHPVNSQPAVGRLGKGEGLTERLAVVVPVGAQPLPGSSSHHYNTAISAFDAKTGEPIWQYTPPVWNYQAVAGDFRRMVSHTICMPNPYGSPSIDARGTAYVGHFNGMIYAIRDDNGDGQIQEEEVSKFDTGAGFSHGGSVLAPGTMAIPSCDGLFVFRE